MTSTSAAYEKKTDERLNVSNMVRDLEFFMSSSDCNYDSPLTHEQSKSIEAVQNSKMFVRWKEFHEHQTDLQLSQCWQDLNGSEKKSYAWGWQAFCTIFITSYARQTSTISSTLLHKLRIQAWRRDQLVDHKPERPVCLARPRQRDLGVLVWPRQPCE